jgi:MFS family permease
MQIAHLRIDGAEPSSPATMTERPERRLNWLLASSTVSNLGDGIGKVAFPLLAATLTREPLLIAGLSATQFLPWLLFALLAGVLVDRIDRRRAMIVANVARALIVGGLGMLAAFDIASIWLIYAAALLIGTAETVADSAANVLVPAVVTRDRLESANSKLQAAEIVGQTFLGAPVGSLTFAVFAAMPFLLNSAGFALSAVLLLGLAGSYRPKTGEIEGPAPSVRADLGEGLRWLRRSPLLLRLVVTAGLLSLISEFAQAQLVLYALEDLRISEAAFGFFTLVGGIGGLAGAAFAPRLVAWCGRRALLVAAISTSGVGFAGMGISSAPVVSAALFGVFAAGVVAANVVLATVRHAVVPGELLGRVLGVWRTVVWGAIPLGALLGGVLTEVLGSPSATFVVSGVLQVALAVVAFGLLRGYGRDIAAADDRTDT